MQSNENHLTITGNIRYNMTNDYMFRSILQSNPNILRGLLGALLHISPSEIEEISIENPILLGENIQDKKYILDILVKLNRKSLINLEMQLLNKRNWNDRSLLYLCRVFSNVDAGCEYNDVLPATHIGIMNYTVSQDKPFFYSTYKLLDTKNHRVFNDKFALSMVDLTQTELATDEDKAYQIDRWAKIFIAKTWEELRMLTKDNEYMEEVTKSLYKCNLDPQICKQCQDWEFEQKLIKMDQNYRIMLEHDNELLLDKQNQLINTNTQLETTNAQLETTNSKLKEANSELMDENARLRAQLAALTQSQTS